MTNNANPPALPTLEQMRAWARTAWYDKTVIGHTSEGVALHSYQHVHPKNMGQFAGVYAIWRDDALLYIGYSKTVQKRLRSHFLNWKTSDSRLFPTHATALEFPDAASAAAHEADLILHYLPRFNVRREPRGGQVRDFSSTRPAALRW